MLLPATPAAAQTPTFSITNTTWDVLGLDSNRPAARQGYSPPGTFPVGARICNTSSVVASSVWATLALGTATKGAGSGSDPFSAAVTSRDLGSVAANSCEEAVFNVSVNQHKNSFFWKKAYTISARTTSATGTIVATTPSTRALYVEKLVSQNRNATISITSNAPWDATNSRYKLSKGETYKFTLNAKSAPGGYEQTEAFINFPESVFEIQTIKSFYSTPTGGTADGIYADACGFDNDSTSLTWRTCIGPAKYTGGKAGGNPIKVVYTVKVVGTSASGGLSAMIYDLSGSSYHYNGDFSTATKSFEAITSADLKLTKTDNGAFVRNGTGQYTLTVTNNGPDPTSGNVTITDTLPSGLTYSSVDATSTSGWSCSAAGQTVTCNNATVMASGATSTLKMNVAVGASATKGTITNTATVTNSVSDPDTSDNTATDTGTIADPPEADISIAKTHSAAYFPIGSNSTYSIAVKNEGPAAIANQVRVTDTLPAGLTYVSASGSDASRQWSCGASGQTVTCDLQTLLGAASGLTTNTPAPILTLTVTPSGTTATKVTNTASVAVLGTGNPVDPNTTNDSSSDETFIGAADLEITKTHSGDFPIPPPTPAQGTFSLSVKNSGPNAAPGPITVTDTLPTGLTYSSASGTGWSCSNASQTVTCTRSTDLASGDTAPAISLVVDVASTVPVDSTTNRGILTNIATVDGPSTLYDPDPDDDTSEDVVALTKQQDLSVTVSDSPDPVTAPNALTYTVTVTNANTDSTGVTASGVFWDMDLPSGTTFTSVDPDGAGAATALTEADLESTTADQPCSYSSTGHFLSCELNTGTSSLTAGSAQSAFVIVGTSLSTPTSISTNVEAFMDQSDGRTDNNTANTSTTVTGGNSPPTVTVTATSPVDEHATTQQTITWSAWDSSGTVNFVSTSCGLAGTKVASSDTTPTGSGTQASPKTATFKCIFDNGPATSEVSMTASDGTNTSTGTSTVTVTNVNPTATLVAPSSAQTNASFTVELTNADDVSSSDDTAGFTYDFDCGSGYDGTFGSVASTSCTAPSSPEARTVKGKVQDQNGGTTEYTASVTIVGPPTADATSASLSHKSAAGVDVTLTGQDTTGADLTFSIVSGPAIGTLGSITGTNCTGTTTKTCTATVHYSNPGTDTLGNTSFTYKATRTGPVDSSAATATITRTDAAPTATVALSPDTVTTNSTLTGTATKSDADGDTVTLTYLWKVTRDSNTCTVKTTSGSANLTDTLDLGASHTTTDCSGTNPVSLNPATGDVVEVFVTPNDGHTSGTEVSASKTIGNSAPVATDQTDGSKATTNEDVNKTITLAGTDADSDTLTFKVTSLPSNGSLWDGPDATGHEITSSEATAGYTVTDASKRVTFVPTANYNNGASTFGPSFTFTVTDPAAASDSGTVQIDVNPVNDTPTWNATVSMSSGGSLDLSTVSADVETADANLSYTFVGTDGGATKGTPTITGQTLTYARDGGATGTDSVTIRVTDRGDPDNCGSVVAGACTAAATADKTITINLDNETPVATPQTGASKVVTDEDTNKVITLAGTDADSDPLTFKVTSLPSDGSLYDGSGTGGHLITSSEATAGYTVTDSSNRVTFVPTANYNNGATATGPSFTFVATDGTDTSAAATVAIDVDPVNDAPAAADTTITTSSATATVNLVNITTDTETASANHTYKITALPAQGTLKDGSTTITSGALPYTMTNGTTVTYTQPANDTTDDSFTYTATDRGDPDNCGTVVAGACTAALSDAGTVTVDVTNAGPTATSQTGGTKVSVTEDGSTLITLAGTDPEGDTLTFKVTSQPSNGKLYKGASTDAADEITGATSGSPISLTGATVTFVPTANYNNGASASGPSFTFTATDATGSNTTSSAATVDIDVNPVNDTPTWNATVSMSSTGSLDLKDVSADVETADANLTYAIVTNGSKGTATRTGSVITYTRNADETGTDSIVVSVTDRGDPDNCGSVVAGSCTAAETVNKTITINLENTAPVATDQTSNDKASMNEDANRTITLAGTDADGDTLTFKVTGLPSNGSLYDGSGTGGHLITSSEATAGYTVTDASKRVTFVPTANYNNGASAFGPSFTFTVTDPAAASDAGTVQIDVDPVNDTPTWDATISMGSGGSLDLSTVSADVETADANLSYTFVGTDGGATKGTPTITDRTLTYVRDGGQTGTDSVTIRVTDRGDPDNCGSVVAGACTAAATADKTITINLDNETPVATSQTGGTKVSVNEDSSVLVTLAGTDADGDPLTFKVTSVPSNGKLYKGASTAGTDEITSASSGSPVTLTAATVTFVPTANYNNGAAATGASFTFVASDGTDTSAAATVEIDVNPLNDAPAAADTTITTSSGSATVNLVNITTDQETSAANHTYKVTGLPTDGTLKDGATTISSVPYTMTNGTTVTYTQPANYNTDVSFTYSATDRGDPDNCGTVVAGACTAALTDAGTVSVDVTNAAPSASAQTLATNEDTAKLITLTGTDPETDALTFKITGLPTNGVLKDGTTTITSGMLPRTLVGALTYEPAANHNSGAGSPESFTFKSNDTFSDSANATVTIDVDPVNDTPTWDATVGVGAAGSLDLQTVSADIETLDANLVYSIVTNGTKGTATLAGSTLTYSQSADKNGTDTITVRVTDRGDPDNCGTVVAGSCTATLTADKDVTITLVQTAPVATSQTGGSKIVIDEDDAGELITFAGTDAQGDTITFKVTTLPSNGKLYVGSSTATTDEIESADLPATTGSVTFVPTADYNNGASASGPSFTFSATDALGSNSAGSGTVDVDVNPVNDQPTWNTTVSMGESASRDLKSVSADVETADADLTYSIVTNGTKGTATLTGATLTYAKTAGQTGTDTVTVRVTDRGDPDNCGSAVAGACTAVKTADKAVSILLDANNPPTATVTLHTLPNTGDAAVLTSTQAPKTNDKVRATSSCSDSDGDNVTLTFVWKVTRLDNSVATVQTTTVSAGQCSGTFTDTLDLSKTGFGDKGETVKVEVTPNDGKVDGSIATGSTTVVITDTPPTATDRIIKTGVGQAKEVILEGSDVDGESVSFGITQQPATGTLVLAADSTKDCFVANGTSGTRGSYTSPGTETCHLKGTYTPANGITGSITFKYKVENSAAASRIATVTVQIEANVQTGTKQTDDAEQETVQGALVSTGSTPSTDDPVETQIVAARNGRIIIKEEPIDETPPSGFSFFAQQIDIQVLDGNDDPVTTSASEPQRFTFLLDQSMLPSGKTVSDIEIYRNGAKVSACTGGSDLVQPTPACVLSRTLTSGTIKIEVLTTAASTWHFAFPVPVSSGGGGAAPAPTPTPTPTPEPTEPTDPSTEPEPPLAALKIHNPKLVRGRMVRMTGKLRVCPGHEGTLLHLTAKIDGATEAKTLQIKTLDETCHVDYRVRAKFKRALFNVYWPPQDDDHHRGIGIPHWAVTRRLPGPLAVLWVSDHSPERGQLLTMYGWLRRCPGHRHTKMHLVAKIDGAKEAELISVKKLNGRCRAKWTVRADFDRAIFNVRWPKQHHDHKKGNGRPHVVVTH